MIRRTTESHDCNFCESTAEYIIDGHINCHYCDNEIYYCNFHFIKLIEEMKSITKEV